MPDVRPPVASSADAPAVPALSEEQPHRCVSCGANVSANQIVSIGNRDSARDLRCEVGDEVCTGCYGEN